MFEKLFNYLRILFNLSETTTDKPVPTVPKEETPKVPEKPVKEDKEPDIVNWAQDGSEVQSDTVITVIDENKDVVISGDEAIEETEIGFDGDGDDIPDVIDDMPEIPHPETGHKPRYLWCLDGGHGKESRGKRSPVYNGNEQFFEYEFNRDIVERIMKRLDSLGVRYFDVVPDYESVGNILEERVNRANWKQSSLPKIYLSIHSNAGPTRTPNDWVVDRVSGIETWFYHGSRSGRSLATVFQRRLIEATGWKNRHIKSRDKNQFYVLKKTKMPAILTENGFYNNENQVKAMQQDSVRQMIAEAHVRAILEVEAQGIK